MNIRQRYELKTLIEYKQFEIVEIAKTFSVVERTIRYDIRELNRLLEEDIICINNNIVSIATKNTCSLQKLLNTSVYGYYGSYLTSKERSLMIVANLCWNDKYITIQELAENYGVSRGTINADIKDVKKFCVEEGIKIVSQKGKGIRIEATESKRRQYLAHIFHAYSQIAINNDEFDSNVYTQWFNEEDLRKIKDIIRQVEDEFSIYLDDVAYEALTIHIALSTKRFINDSKYCDVNTNYQIDEESIQYKMASHIIRLVNECFIITLPETEVFYVAIHIGAKSSEVINLEMKRDIFLEYYCIKIISNVSKLLGVDLTNDQKLYGALRQHLAACAYRKKMGMILENPLKDELIDRYPDLYQFIKAVLQDVNEPSVVITSDDEVAYILLHFAAAINRKKLNKNRPIRVVVVCATGIGTAELVVSSLKKRFYIDIIGNISRHQLNKYLEEHDIDMIISTVPIVSDLPYVIVRPILTEEDIAKLSKEINRLGFKTIQNEETPSDESELAGQLLMAIKQYGKSNEADKLKKSIEGVLNTYKRSGETKFMLSELINENTIRLNVDARDWEEAVAKAGEPLISNHSITVDYITAVINNVKELGPYIVITKGVALPHASNQEGVNKTSMSLVTLKTPVNFGNKNNDPVKSVFMLATVDSASHLGALQDLVTFLEKDDFMELLEKANSPKEIEDYIIKYEEGKEGNSGGH